MVLGGGDVLWCVVAEVVDVAGLVVVKAVLDEDGGAGSFEVVDIVLTGGVVCVLVLPCMP